MNRRHALCCSAAIAAGLFTSLAAKAQAPSLAEGLVNPCRGALPPDLAQHDLVLAAFEGLDPAALWDVHCHLLGTGDSGSGCSVSAQMYSGWHPQEVMRRRMILNAACVPQQAPSIDRAYVDRLVALTDAFPDGARWLLYAFDQACDDQGRADAASTTFHVPDGYAAQVAAARPRRFAWVASVHPYRDDAMARLDAALQAGAVAIKWLPSAMNIDLRDPRCGPFYDRLAQRRVPLIVHGGEERAVPGAGRADLGNPLLVRVPLARRVRVIVAHAASLGQATDLDRTSRPIVPAFELWSRLMDERTHEALLLADISAVFQANRTPAVWRSVLAHDAWHDRLLHGSDYPLPGVMPLYAPQRFVDAGLLADGDVEPLRRIRRHNPLLFDLVLKRRLRLGTARLPAAVFETKRHFAATSLGYIAATAPSPATGSRPR